MSLLMQLATRHARAYGSSSMKFSRTCEFVSLQIVRPPLHQLRPVGHIRGPVIRGPDLVLLPVRELPLDHIWVPSVFIGYGRKQRPEPVGRGDALVAHARER